MTIDLSKAEFENDVLSVELPSGDLLVLNILDEAFYTSDNTDTVVNRINIGIVDTDGNTTICPCVIGFEHRYFKLKTDYSEYEGKILDGNNFKYCYIETVEGTDD